MTMNNFLSAAPSAEAAVAEPELWFICVLGIAVVFVGLVCIILMVLLMNKLTTVGRSQKEEAPAAKTAVAFTPASAVTESNVIENRSEIIAAIVAAVAEESDTDISAIRVLSFKKL